MPLDNRQLLEQYFACKDQFVDVPYMLPLSINCKGVPMGMFILICTHQYNQAQTQSYQKPYQYSQYFNQLTNLGLSVME